MFLKELGSGTGTGSYCKYIECAGIHLKCVYLSVHSIYLKLLPVLAAAL